MRNALILLAVVALAIITAGAINHSVAVDVDWVAGTWRAVSLFWVAVTVAAIVFTSGLAAALLGRAGALRVQRRLETELDTTYRRVRELEAGSPVAQTAGRGSPSVPIAAAIAQGASRKAASSQGPSLGTPSRECSPGAQTAVTVVAANGSAKVTQVLPATSVPGTDAPAATGVASESDGAGDDAPGQS